MNVKEHEHDDEFCLECSLAQIEPFYPRRGPIKDFVAQNTLQGFIDRPFDEALDLASKLYGSKTHMDLSFYREKFNKQEISQDRLMEALEHYFPSLNNKEQELMLKALFGYVSITDQKTFDVLVMSKNIDRDRAKNLLEDICQAFPREKPPLSITSVIKKRLGHTLDHQVNPILFRLIGSFTDQGVSLWPYLEKYNSFTKAVYQLAQGSFFPLASFVNNRDLLLDLEPDLPVAIRQLCKKILASPSLYPRYIKETLLEHAGWSAMVNAIEKNPSSLAKSITISIKEFLLVKLAIQWQFIKNHDENFLPITTDDLVDRKRKLNPHALSLSWWILGIPGEVQHERVLSLISLQSLQKIWHLAMESEYYRNVQKIIAKGPKPQLQAQKKFQAVFCIDDRECSFRRFLEEISPDVETLSFPGFFGIDCYFKAHKRDLLEKMCPLPVTPKHIVMEKSINPRKITPEKKLLELASFISLHGANSTLFGFISAYTLGHLSLLRLMMGFFQPLKLLKTKQLSAQDEKTFLQFERVDDKKFKDLSLGYTIEEMADRVFNALNSMGLVNPCELVFLIAHGSSSVNNPHFAAYDCGACSGRPGAINSRVFALMANMPAVRELVKQKGRDIPKSTIFIGGFHDTCNDDVTLFDTENLTLKHSLMVDEFLRHVDRARAKNAKERCKKFALVSPSISEGDALKEVHHRSRALFEPRPELGHANNALCIVGRRDKTYQLNFDRRAFLQSYDPTIDEDGKILSSLMTAIIPVCGGINLEYFFSRIDPAIYGCGTKLSHNVCSLLGVGNGLDDDLRTGLPIQTTELHDPVRLLLIIEQSEAIIISAIKANPPLIPWVTNDWIKLASLNPDSQEVNLFSPKAADFI